MIIVAFGAEVLNHWVSGPSGLECSNIEGTFRRPCDRDRSVWASVYS